MSLVDETTIRVPIPLRDKIRDGAATRRVRQAEYLKMALAELEQAEFLKAVAATNWGARDDDDNSWLDIALTSELDPWEPQR